MDSLRELVAGELRAILARRRISAAELGRRLGWSQTYIARRMDGRAPLDMDDLDRIARELQIAVTDLMPRVAHARIRDTEGYAASTDLRTPLTRMVSRHIHHAAGSDPALHPSGNVVCATPSIGRPAIVPRQANP